MRARFAITPERFATIAKVALVMLTVIVFTGAAVRLTGSGLGCSTWPKCESDQLYAPLETHSVIEFSNRILTFFVSASALAAVAGAWLRAPYRRDLFRLSLLLPLGVLTQAVLGGLTVLYELSPGWVMSHYIVSMFLLIAAFALYWKARPAKPAAPEPGERPADRQIVLVVRLLAPVALIAIAAGTAATAAGPHAGGAGTDDEVVRLTFKGADTLKFLISSHGALVTLFGIAALGVWFLARVRRAPRPMQNALTALCVMLAAQGIVGGVQYALELPAEIVWFHVTTATLTWLVVLWTWASAGPLPAKGVDAPERRREAVAA